MDYRPIIESRYNRQNWQLLLHDIFGNKIKFWNTPSTISTSSQFAKHALWLGSITLSDNQTISVYEVELSDSVDIERNRRGIRDMLLTDWRSNGNAGAFMFCYRKNESVLRFSYVSEAWTFADDGSYQKESTDAKRFTYLLGEGHRSRTAIQQFEKLRDSSLTLKDLTKAFSVEAVSDMFFDGYKKQYEDIIQYITGKRMVKVANKWEEKIMHEPCEEIMQEFAHFQNPEKAVRDYVKKLMSRLEFLQFLQKKGWLGVPVGAEWGTGDTEFIQTLFVQCQDKDHFVDNVLEVLFDDLNTEREGDLATPSIGGGRGRLIPYLNGGLFDRDATDETAFPLPAKYMQNLLDFFASYNFTIDENDPDDAEVGVDPEMLGRIFENLLEDNKDKGAFYTPKEIVNYMCRESLIAYLQTDIEDEANKEAIRQFVTTHDAATLGNISKDIDQRLKDVKICDPAIGSGAFPMGLLKELFQCRTALEGISQHQAAEIKKHIIQKNIYGVDIERGAVDIARLRFWLSLVVDEETPQALPNLDYKIVEGNSLITAFDGQYIDLSTNIGTSRLRSSLVRIRPEKKALQAEQRRFFTLSGDEKYRSEIAIKNHILNIIWYQLDYEKHSWEDATIEQAGLFGATTTNGRKKNTAQVVEFTQERQTVLDKCEILMAKLNDESKSLQERANITIPFFEWEVVFSDVFDDDNKKGFDIVIGNPPYNELRDLSDDFQILYKKSPYFKYAQGGRINMFQYFYPLSSNILSEMGICSLITQNSLLAEDSALNNRKLFFEKFKICAIDSFPERDNVKLRVFESAKMSVCICLLQKGLTIDNYFDIRVWRSKCMNSGHVLSIKKKDIKNVYPDDLIFPICNKEGWQLLLKMKGHSDFVINAQAGEIDMTKYKPLFLRSNLNGERRVITGAQILRYKITDTPSQGGIVYLNPSMVKLTNDRIESVSRKRIVIQRITGVDSRIRIISTLAPANLYCANSTNYISPTKNNIDLTYLLGVLNSKCVNFFFKQTSTNTNVTGKEIAKFPIPLANTSIRDAIIDKVECILSKKRNDISEGTSALESEIDRLVYQLYGLTYDEVLIVDQGTPITREEYGKE